MLNVGTKILKYINTIGSTGLAHKKNGNTTQKSGNTTQKIFSIVLV